MSSEMSEEREMITGMEAPIYLKYHFTAGEATSRFLAKVKQGIEEFDDSEL